MNDERIVKAGELRHRRLLRYLYGVAAAVSAIPQMLALHWIPVVPYVIVSKRAGTILFSVLLGFIFAFIVKRPDFQKEKENLWHRVFGVLLMIIGMVVIILYGHG